MTLDLTEEKRVDTLIARVLIGKPQLTPSILRRIVPNLDHYDDQALAQKIEHLRRRNARRPPVRL